MKRDKNAARKSRWKKKAIEWSFDRQVENAVYHLRREREEAARLERNRAAVIAGYERYIKRREARASAE